jgi:hypothetical protein
LTTSGIGNITVLPPKVGFSVEPEVSYPRWLALTAARELSQNIVSDGIPRKL